jgi:hypothetical protein
MFLILNSFSMGNYYQAMSACSFVSGALYEVKADAVIDKTKLETLKEDVQIIDSVSWI